MKRGWLVVWPDSWVPDIVRTQEAAQAEKRCGAKVYECDYGEPYNIRNGIEEARKLRA